MSRTNYDLLTSRFPQLENVWSFLASWTHERPEMTLYAMNHIARDAKHLTLGELNEAVELLCRQGVWERRVGVSDPDGVLIKVFDRSETRLPETVHSLEDDLYYRLEDLDVTEVFREAKEVKREAVG